MKAPKNSSGRIRMYSLRFRDELNRRYVSCPKDDWLNVKVEELVTLIKFHNNRNYNI